MSSKHMVEASTYGLWCKARVIALSLLW